VNATARCERDGAPFANDDEAERECSNPKYFDEEGNYHKPPGC